MYSQNLATKIEPQCQWWVGEAINHTVNDAVQIFTAGLGTGKTHGLCELVIERLTRNYKSKFAAIFEPTYALIHDVAIPTMIKVLESYGYAQNEDYRLTRSAPYPRVVFTATDQEIHFRSFQNPDTIVGVEYCCAGMDEAALGKKRAYENINIRVRDPNAILRQTFLALSPQGLNYAAEEFDSDALSGWDQRDRFISDCRYKPYRRYKLRTDDNPFIGSAYLKKLDDMYGYNPNILRSYRYGEFCAFTEGTAYSNYRPQLHNIPDREPSPHREILLTWDFNAAPLSWISIQIEPLNIYINESITKRAICFHEANMGATDLYEACLEFAAKHDPQVYGDTPILLAGDSTGHHNSHKTKGTDYENIKNYLIERGFRKVQIIAAHSNPLETVSVEAVQKLFHMDALYLCQRLKELPKSLMATTWQKGIRKLYKPADDTWTHPSDALKYGACTYLVKRIIKSLHRSYGV